VALRTRSRGLTPVAGSIVLLACCVVASGLLAAAVTGTGASALGPPASTPSAVDVTAHVDGSVVLVYRAGPPLDVRALRVRVFVDGRPLRHQPTVPFVGEPGFDGAPTGPFNAASDPTWTAGERAGFRVAGTNAPAVSAGERVVVTLSSRGRAVATVSTRVTPPQGGRARAS